MCVCGKGERGVWAKGLGLTFKAATLIEAKCHDDVIIMSSG